MNEALSLIYPAKIVFDDAGYVVTFRDLKNIFSEGDTFEEAIFNAQKVLDILLLDMTQDDFDIPTPTACHKCETLIAVSSEVAVPVLLHTLRKEHHCTIVPDVRITNE